MSETKSEVKDFSKPDSDVEYTGKVVFFSSKKGFGFITADQDGKDYFLHFSHLKMQGYKTCRANDLVSFKLGHNANGPIAVEVTVTQKASESEFAPEEWKDVDAE
jgi:CspA family cold shock protein